MVSGVNYISYWSWRVFDNNLAAFTLRTSVYSSTYVWHLTDRNSPDSIATLHYMLM